MNILHVIPAFHPTIAYGGPSDSVHRLCSSLTVGARVRVLTTNANGLSAVLNVDTRRDIGLADGLRVRYCRRIARHTVAPSLVRLLPSYLTWADVVHLTAVYSFPTIPTLLLSRALGKPVIWSPRGACQRWEKTAKIQAKTLWDICCRLVAPKSLMFHATSDDEAKAIVGLFPGSQLCVIPNGVEIPDSVRHIAPAGLLRLVYLGRLHPIKGIENLLEACQRLNAHGKRKWSLSIAGNGDKDYVSTLKAKITACALGEQVSLLGDLRGEAKRNLFEAADVVIVPSYSENFGLVVAEALAHGVPVIASKGTPWNEMEKLGCGLWVDNDAASLAQSIEQISKMPLRRLGEQGRAWMAEEFSWSRRAGEMLAAYQSLLRPVSAWH